MASRKKKRGIRIVGEAKLVAEAMKDIKVGYAESGPKVSGWAPAQGGMKSGAKKGYGATSYGKAKEAAKKAAKKKAPPKKSPPKKQPPKQKQKP